MDLDSLLNHFRRPDVVKIDVEGAELTVLNGSHQLIGDVRPVFCMEVSTANRDRVATVFSDNSYTLFNATGFQYASNPVPYCSANTIAIPFEKTGNPRL
jgi:hypothetical protein